MLFGQVLCQHWMWQVKIWANGHYITRCQGNVIFRNQYESHRFSSVNPVCLHQCLLTQQPVFFNHRLVLLSNYHFGFLRPLILWVYATTDQLPHCLPQPPFWTICTVCRSALSNVSCSFPFYLFSTFPAIVLLLSTDFVSFYFLLLKPFSFHSGHVEICNCFPS
jgi:hypothetical protein